MIDLYVSVIRDGRTPERGDALIENVKLLYDAGYDDVLDDIVGVVGRHDAVADALPEVEQLILRAMRAFTIKLGITISDENIHAQPSVVNDILMTLLEHLENYDDVDSMMAIADSGEPAQIVLGDLVGFVLGKNCYKYIDIIDEVSDKLSRTVRSVLISRQRIQQNSLVANTDFERALRVSKYVLRYPHSYAAELLDDCGYQQTTSELISKIELDPIESANYLEEVAIVIGGIMVSEHDELSPGLEAIDSMVGKVLDPVFEDKHLTVCKAVMNAIRPIYDETKEEIGTATESWSTDFE